MGAETSIPCDKSVRDLIREQKRAGEDYNSVLRKMALQYDPDESPPGFLLEKTEEEKKLEGGATAP